jgi:hypothetical protein
MMNHEQRKGDKEKVLNAVLLKDGLVCGEQGKQIKERKRVEQKQMRVHNANVKKRVTVLNEIGNEVLNVFSQGLEQPMERGKNNETLTETNKKKRGANDLLKANTNRKKKKKGKRGQEKHKEKPKKSAPRAMEEAPITESVKKIKEVNKEICRACQHCPMMELVMMEHQYVKTYLRNEGYFSGKVCKGACGRQIEDIAKRRGPEIYYCKIDFNQATLEDTVEEGEIRCNFIICNACRQAKVDKFDEEKQREEGGVIRSKRARRPKQRL